MDILYHAVVGVAISKIYGVHMEFPAAMCAMLPDIVGTAPYFYFKLAQSSHGPLEQLSTRFYTSLTSNKFSNSIDTIAYRITHSGFSAIFFGIVTFYMFPTSWHILTLSYASHIIIDIPTHDGDHATRFLYPFSDMHINAFNWAIHMRIFIKFWVILLFIVIYLYS